MNKVILVGRLVKDVEPRYAQNGKCVSTFTLAVNDFKNESATFLNIVAWDKLGESCANYLSKGSKALVEGRIQIRNYDGKDGKKVYVTEIIATSVEFLDSKKENQQEKQNYNNIGSVQNEEIPF